MEGVAHAEAAPQHAAGVPFVAADQQSCMVPRQRVAVTGTPAPRSGRAWCSPSSRTTPPPPSRSAREAVPPGPLWLVASVLPWARRVARVVGVPVPVAVQGPTRRGGRPAAWPAWRERAMIAPVQSPAPACGRPDPGRCSWSSQSPGRRQAAPRPPIDRAGSEALSKANPQVAADRSGYTQGPVRDGTDPSEPSGRSCSPSSDRHPNPIPKGYSRLRTWLSHPKAARARVTFTTARSILPTAALQLPHDQRAAVPEARHETRHEVSTSTAGPRLSPPRTDKIENQKYRH